MPDPLLHFKQTLVAVARREIGKKETEGPNEGPDVRKYQKATWLDPGPWYWCAAFVCWCVAKAVELTGLRPFSGKLPRTAGAFDFANWADDKHPDTGKYMARSGKGVIVLDPKTNRVEFGDIVIYKSSHIGIASSGENSARNFSAVEGNTNDGGSRNGDGTYERNRNASELKQIVRIVGPENEQ